MRRAPPAGRPMPGTYFVPHLPGVARIASVVFGAQLAHHGAGLPHLALAHLTQLFVELLAVVGLAVEVDRTLGLVAGGDFAVKLLEDGFRGVAETFPPIQRAWAVVEQLAYIQSMPFSATSGMSDCVSSSTVSLKASEGVWPLARSVSYWAAKMP